MFSALIVENDPEALSSLERLFENQWRQWGVRTASSGRQAMEFLESEKFDLLLSNIELPGDITGFTLYEEVRNRDLETEVILMGSSEDHEAECARQGVDGFLEKPVRGFGLQTMLETLSLFP